jgi:predicted RNase H-like nuclease
MVTPMKIAGARNPNALVRDILLIRDKSYFRTPRATRQIAPDSG